MHWYLQWELRLHSRLCSTCAQKRAAAGQHNRKEGITAEMMQVKCHCTRSNWSVQIHNCFISETRWYVDTGYFLESGESCRYNAHYRNNLMSFSFNYSLYICIVFRLLDRIKIVYWSPYDREAFLIILFLIYLRKRSFAPSSGCGQSRLQASFGLQHHRKERVCCCVFSGRHALTSRR